jgi:hypothetical protein
MLCIQFKKTASTPASVNGFSHGSVKLTQQRREPLLHAFFARHGRRPFSGIRFLDGV